MDRLPPWAIGAYELILHGEGHLLSGEDFDRHMTLISFDNAIEVSISTYLNLNPLQRDGREYKRDDVDKWLKNYHTKLEFLEEELKTRKDGWGVDRESIIYLHDLRNDAYHVGHRTTPSRRDLELLRQAAIWIFSYLFEIKDCEQRIARNVKVLMNIHDRNPYFDEVIDREFEAVLVGDDDFYLSNLLFELNYERYMQFGKQVISGMSLHEIIALILEFRQDRKEKPITIVEINQQYDLYQKGDGTYPDEGQIKLRAKKHTELFSFDDDGNVCLIE